METVEYGDRHGSNVRARVFSLIYAVDSKVFSGVVADRSDHSLAAHFAGAACERGERCLYFAFEESPE